MRAPTNSRRRCRSSATCWPPAAEARRFFTREPRRRGLNPSASHEALPQRNRLQAFRSGEAVCPREGPEAETRQPVGTDAIEGTNVGADLFQILDAHARLLRSWD